jgi:hypothetical protein
MSPLKIVGLLLAGAASADAGCVRMQKFDTDDCTGDAIQDKQWMTSNEENSKCVKWSWLSFKDQHCTADGGFKQKLYFGPGCILGPIQQEFEKGVCQSKVIFTCDTTAETCEAEKPKIPAKIGKATATLLKYGTKDCSDKPVEVKFPTARTKGTPCFNMGSYSVKDQYCDTDGKFKQTAFKGSDCQGHGMDQVYDHDHCMYGFKLGSCAPVSDDGYVGV